MTVDVAEGEPSLDTEEEAIDAFVASGGDFQADATFEGQQIIYEGESSDGYRSTPGQQAGMP